MQLSKSHTKTLLALAVFATFATSSEYVQAVEPDPVYELESAGSYDKEFNYTVTAGKTVDGNNESLIITGGIAQRDRLTVNGTLKNVNDISLSKGALKVGLNGVINSTGKLSLGTVVWNGASNPIHVNSGTIIAESMEFTDSTFSSFKNDDNATLQLKDANFGSCGGPFINNGAILSEGETVIFGKNTTFGANASIGKVNGEAVSVRLNANQGKFFNNANLTVQNFQVTSGEHAQDGGTATFHNLNALHVKGDFEVDHYATDNTVATLKVDGTATIADIDANVYGSLEADKLVVLKSADSHMSSIIAGTLEVQSSANFLDLENLKVDHLKVNGGDKPSAYVKFDFKDGAGNTVDLESAEFNGKKTTLQLFNANLDLDQVTVTEGSKGYINFKEGTDQTGTVGVVKVNQNAKFDVITEKANSKTTIDSITLEENSTFGGGGDKLLTNNATINVTDITVNGDAQISKVGGLLTNTTLSIDKMEVNKGTLTVASTQKIAGKEFDLTVNEGAKVDIQFSVDAQAFNVYANTLVADSVKVAQTGENTNATVYVGSDLNTKVAREIVNDIHAAVSMDKDYAYEVADGDIYGAIRGKGDTYTQAKNANLTGLGSVTALSTMTWLHEMNSLNKRMGELRDAPQGVGSWVRLYGSEMEYGVQNVQSKNTTIQVGSDISVGDWKVGLAANYTDGESSYDNGSADSKNYGIAIYGSWLAPCGGYLDLIAKYSRLDHDYAMGNMKGNYDNNALNLSVETGYRFEFMEDRVFVEPQLELAYGHISGADYMASNDVRVDLDSYTSFTGRLGVRTGFKFPDNKGSVYARVSGVYDFDGEIDYKASKGDMYDNFHEDLGGAWVEYGIGANFNWTENTYTYVDLERTSGGEVRENYRWNIGLRHVF